MTPQIHARFEEFDKKERLMLAHYKCILEKGLFDEYDILGFLIFIRCHINKDRYPYILDFAANLIAHRKRDKGAVMNAISAAINNNYAVLQDGKTIKGYHGMPYAKWESEWLQLHEDFNIKLNRKTISDITLCVFSLAQFTEYEDKSGNKGQIELFQSNDGSYGLYTTEGTPHSLFICFAKSEQFPTQRFYSAGHITNPVETVRENGILRLRDCEGFII